MYNFTKVYGKATIKQEEDESLRTIKLKYYKTKQINYKKNEKQYGVGIIKTEIKNNELNEEKQEINHICKYKHEVEKLLDLLIRNKVTPVDLKYVLEDMSC